MQQGFELHSRLDEQFDLCPKDNRSDRAILKAAHLQCVQLALATVISTH